MARSEGQDELRRVYRAHVRAVYGFFAYSVRAATAEDLTSATFERVLAAWPSFDPAKGSERTWILTIARNQLTDHYRRERLRTTTSTDEHPALLDTLSTTEHPLAAHLEAEAIKSWLGELDERAREILAMRFVADLSPAEIAELMELTVDNVHQILSRSLRKMRAGADRD